MRFMKPPSDMMKFSLQIALLTTVLVSALAGCVSQRPARYIDDVNDVTLRYKTRDARAQRIEGWPCLRVDAISGQHLNNALASDDLSNARTEALAFLDEARKLTVDTAMIELERLKRDGWDELTLRQFGIAAGDDQLVRDRLKELFITDTELRYWFLRHQIDAAQTVQAIHEVLAPIAKQIETPVKQQGRLSRMLPWSIFTIPSAIVVSQIHAHEYRGDLDGPFDAAIRYTPDITSTNAPEGIDQEDWSVLKAYAPVIIQEHPETVTYDRTVDHFGRVTAPDAQTVAIDTSNPTVYAYSRHLRIQDQPRTQLIYTYWYPEHPALKPNDPEAGLIEGITMRITLNEQRKPIAFETLYNCGCYHRLYPTCQLEQRSVWEYETPETGKRFVVERRVPGKIDAIVPKLVDTQTGDQPVIRAHAGWHGIANVATDEADHEGEVIGDNRYTLRPYNELERLKTPSGQTVSMFYENGLVKGAQRLEGVFFTPLGLLSAGQPRQRGTQMIHWDHYDFDDPKLLETLLRLPQPKNNPSVAQWTGSQ
jgi:hypothetical protein